MDLLYTVAITLVTLGILVAIHEFGHFWVARRCGVHVLRFSIGFGKPILTWRDKLGTEYSVGLIFLGGYVRMLGEGDGEIPPDKLDQAFNRKPVLQRIAIVAAGPLANLLLAVVAYWGIYMAGESGYVPIVDKVEQGSIADVAGLEPGQEIIAVDGVETPTWQALSFRLLDRIGDSGSLRFTVRYPDSETEFESEAVITQWLAGEEQPDLFGGLGLTLDSPDYLPVVGEVLDDSPASRAGLQVGDRVVSADGVTMALWEDWVKYVKARPKEPIRLELARGEQSVSALIVPDALVTEEGERIGRVGVAVAPPEWPPEMVRQFQRGPVEALVAGVERTWDLTMFTFSSIKKMVQGLISPKNLSGPITIAKIASASAKSGLESFVGFLALLSVSLGVLNLLPIPVLDGGHLLFYTLELLAGRPVPEKIQALGYQLGLFMVLGIMAFALYNDFARL